MEALNILCVLCCALVVSVVADIMNNEIPDFEREVPSQGNSVVNDFINEVVHEPVPCQMIKSKYGCCWDKKSIPKGPNGKGCPVCKDRKKRHCKNWADSCHDEVVKKMCPGTCGLCGECKDDPKWTTQCALYKKLDLCYFGDIVNNCKKSCGKCCKYHI